MHTSLYEQHPKCIACKESREMDHDGYHMGQEQAVHYWYCAHLDIEIHNPYEFYCAEFAEIKGGKHEPAKL